MAKCSVSGCPDEGAHLHRFTISGHGWFGETECETAFCCKHFDQLNNEESPFLDLVVIGQERDEV